jgi:hypothetical protein
MDSACRQASAAGFTGKRIDKLVILHHRLHLQSAPQQIVTTSLHLFTLGFTGAFYSLA